MSKEPVPPRHPGCTKLSTILWIAGVFGGATLGGVKWIGSSVVAQTIQAIDDKIKTQDAKLKVAATKLEAHDAKAGHEGLVNWVTRRGDVLKEHESSIAKNKLDIAVMSQAFTDINRQLGAILDRLPD